MKKRIRKICYKVAIKNGYRNIYKQKTFWDYLPTDEHGTVRREKVLERIYSDMRDSGFTPCRLVWYRFETYDPKIDG